MWRSIKETSPIGKSLKINIISQHVVWRTWHLRNWRSGSVLGRRVYRHQGRIHGQQGWNQHHQGWFWKVEVGWEGIYDCELVAWFDKDIGPSWVGLELTIVFIADGFQCSDRGCSHCNDASSSGFDTIEGIGRVLAEGVKFWVHLMFVDIIDRNRSEGSQSNVKGEVDQFYAFSFNLLK